MGIFDCILSNSDMPSEKSASGIGFLFLFHRKLKFVFRVPGFDKIILF